MKLLLLLLAIYSLIFYQSYKIEKAKTPVSGTEKVAKSQEHFEEAVLKTPENINDGGNEFLMTRSQYMHTAFMDK